MADLLGSIMESMEKPPGLDEKQKKLLKAQKAKAEALQAKERDRLKKFKEDLQVKIQEFIDNPEKQKHKFGATAKVERSIIHEVAETAGLVSQAFGQEEVDRYVIVWKKEFSPTEDELSVHRRGDDWNEKTAKEMARKRELNESQQGSERVNRPAKVSASKCRQYDVLASNAVKITSAKSYGFVSSELKKDKRSIEETLNEIRAKKKLRAEAEQEAEPRVEAGASSSL